MSSVGCPRCEESFRVPDAPLPPEIRFRCPWCTETFKLADLSQRLLPMVELIDENDQTIDLASLFSPTNTIRNGALQSLPEPSPSFASAKSALLGTTVESDDENDMEISDVADDGIDLGSPMEDVFSAMETGPGGESLGVSEPTFDSDQFDIAAGDGEPHYDEIDETDPYQTVIDHRDRVQVTGPVAPRPLSPSTTHDFNQGALKAKPRQQKKKGSPVMQMVKVVLGGVAAVPLAAVILSFMGKPLDLGFWPLDGTPLTKIMAGTPMELDDSRPSRRRSAPGRSLAEDMNPTLVPKSESDALEPLSTSEPVPDESADSDDEMTTTSDVGLPSDLVRDNTESKVPESFDVPTALENSTVKPDLVPESFELPDRPPVPVKPERVPNATPPPKEQAVNNMVSGGSTDANTVEVNSAPPISVSFAPPATPELVKAIEQADNALRDVINFKDTSNVKAFQAVKGKLYADLASLAIFPPDSGQDETAALIKRVVDADLIKDMITIGPNWMKYKLRKIDGLFAVGKLVRTDNAWILKWNGTDLQLNNVSQSEFGPDQDKAIDVFLIGKIIDAKPPSIIQVVYMKRQSSH